MATVLEYKCPNCGGKIEFDPDAQKLICPYCDTQFDVEVVKEYNDSSGDNDDIHWDAAEGTAWTPEDDGLKHYICQSCGGEVIGDDNMAATHCPYCDNPVIITDKVSGTLKPDLVIPFKQNKEQAKKALYKFCKGKKLLPKLFYKQNHLDEIKGIYVPYWLFSCDAHAKMSFDGTRTRHWSDSRYVYTETSHFLVNREGDLSFAKVPVDGSKKMQDELMDSLEPFNYNEAVDFKTAYLSGFFADKFDVESGECTDKATARAKRTIEATVRNTVTGYSSVINTGSKTTFSIKNVQYALFPVWILNTTYKDKKYTFAINGQTGKMAGELPVSKSMFFKWIAIYGGIAAAITMTVLTVLYYLG